MELSETSVARCENVLTKHQDIFLRTSPITLAN